jgi:hypothetical protein
LTKVSVQAADIDGLLIGGEPVFYDWEKVGKELGFIYENGFGGTQH